jgi:hypothetical protein
MFTKRFVRGAARVKPEHRSRVEPGRVAPACDALRRAALIRGQRVVFCCHTGLPMPRASVQPRWTTAREALRQAVVEGGGELGETLLDPTNCGGLAGVP